MKNNAEKDRLRQLPSTRLLLDIIVADTISSPLPYSRLVEAARCVIDAERSTLIANPDALPSSTVELASRAIDRVQKLCSVSLQPAINATGIVLHTGLGRARLSDAARQAIADVSASHAMVEIDRLSGKRTSRQDHVRGLLCELTGAESAFVVNNCAGAVFLAVAAISPGREVIISRGELVEIGGGFRMPDIIRASGATLVEVGTTNRTRIEDYENAVTDRTGMIIRCHPSNFAIVGFTEQASTEQLSHLGAACGIPVLDDQGSGALLHPEQLGLPLSNSWLGQSVAAGAGIITASGDKLLGGPQAGIVLGNSELIKRIVGHPLARAIRVDKMTLAALEATLLLYLEPRRALREIPTLRYLTRSIKELAEMAGRLADALRLLLSDRFDIHVEPGSSQVGGGALPGETLPTTCVSLRASNNTPSAEAISEALRRHTPAVFTRIKDQAVLFDPRTLEEYEIGEIAHAASGLSQL